MNGTPALLQKHHSWCAIRVQEIVLACQSSVTFKPTWNQCYVNCPFFEVIALFSITNLLHGRDYKAPYGDNEKRSITFSSALPSVADSFSRNNFNSIYLNLKYIMYFTIGNKGNFLRIKCTQKSRRQIFIKSSCLTNR